MRAAPSGEETDDLSDVQTDENEEVAGPVAVQREWMVRITGCMETAVAADCGRAGDGVAPDVLRMVLDQPDQRVTVCRVLRGLRDLVWDKLRSHLQE